MSRLPPRCRKLALRAITGKARQLPRRVIKSSARPSAKNACSGSGDRFSKGNTAIAGRPSKLGTSGRPRTVCRPSATSGPLPRRSRPGHTRYTTSTPTITKDDTATGTFWRNHRERRSTSGGQRPSLLELAVDASLAASVSKTPSIARRTSPMSRTRRLGSFSRQRVRYLRIVGDRSVGNASHSGSVLMTAAKVSPAVSPSNVLLPVSIS